MTPSGSFATLTYTRVTRLHRKEKKENKKKEQRTKKKENLQNPNYCKKSEYSLQTFQMPRKLEKEPNDTFLIYEGHQKDEWFFFCNLRQSHI